MAKILQFPIQNRMLRNWAFAMDFIENHPDRDKIFNKLLLRLSKKSQNLNNRVITKDWFIMKNKIREVKRRLCSIR